MYAIENLIRKLASQHTLAPIASLGSRLLLALIFIMAGVSKITGFDGTQQYMQAMGVPGGVLPLVIALELGGGLLLLAGFYARSVAALLAGFSVIAAVIFHYQPDDQMQMIMLMKNLAIAGGLLQIVIHGSGVASVKAS